LQLSQPTHLAVLTALPPVGVAVLLQVQLSGGRPRGHPRGRVGLPVHRQHAQGERQGGHDHLPGVRGAELAVRQEQPGHHAATERAQPSEWPHGGKLKHFFKGTINYLHKQFTFFFVVLWKQRFFCFRIFQFISAI